MPKKNTPFLDCNSGISGDMFVAALIDLGADVNKLMESLNSLGLDGVTPEIGKVNKNGISATDFSVINTNHAHEHRGLKRIQSIIDASSLSNNAKNIALRIFDILAEAEATVHGVSKEKIHFHEVGAWDSIMDIAAIAHCVDALGIGEVYATTLTEGSGSVECSHGVLPVPVPAVAEIASMYGIPMNISEVPYEMITPAGISALTALYPSFSKPKEFVVERIGYGAGKRDMAHPNVLRAMMISFPSVETATDGTVWVLETNLDDATGQELGLAMEVLYDIGARDVHCVPVYMKKNRPGHLLRVVCEEKDIQAIERGIFLSTRTIGIRRLRYQVTCLEWQSISVALPMGTVKVKKRRVGNELFYYPEYESVKELSHKTKMQFAEIHALAKQAAYDSELQ